MLFCYFVIIQKVVKTVVFFPFALGFRPLVHFALAGNTLHPLLFVFGVARNPHRQKPVLSRKPVLNTPFRGVPVWLVSLAQSRCAASVAFINR